MTRRGPATLPRQLEKTLLACHQFERAAAGADRRVAWRVTRTLIAAMLPEAYSASLIAQPLGVTAGSVSTRGVAGTKIDRAALDTVPGIGTMAVNEATAVQSGGRNAAHHELIDLREYVRLITIDETSPGSPDIMDGRDERVGGALS